MLAARLAHAGVDAGRAVNVREVTHLESGIGADLSEGGDARRAAKTSMRSVDKILLPPVQNDTPYPRTSQCLIYFGQRNQY